MADLSIKERKRAEKDGHFRSGLFILRLQKRDTLIKKFQSYKLSQKQIPKTLDQIWNIDESLEILIDLQFSAGGSLPKEMVRWTPYRGLSIYQQWKQEKYEHEIFTSNKLDDDKILQLLSTGTSTQKNQNDKQLSLENFMETDKPWESFKDQHIYRLEEEIKSLKRQIKQRNNLLEKLELGDIESVKNSEIEIDISIIKVDKFKVNIFYTAPTAIRALMREGDKPVKKTSRKSLKLLGTVGEPINPEAWM